MAALQPLLCTGVITSSAEECQFHAALFHSNMHFKLFRFSSQSDVTKKVIFCYLLLIL